MGDGSRRVMLRGSVVAGLVAARGGPGPGRLGGRGNSDSIDGSSGADVIVRGPGWDRIRGEAGRDVIRARDGERDAMPRGPDRDSVFADGCGRGRDRVTADRVDLVGADCERVVRQ